MSIARVLIVDDEEHINEIIKDTLEANGFSVISAYDVRSAFEVLRQNKIDVTILDLNLPDAKTTDIVDFMRSSPDLTSIPVIFITAGAADELNYNVISSYRDSVEILYKPFDLKELVKKVNDCLK